MRAAMPRPRRHLFAPEVVQTSAMDCGPAALTCLLAGYGLSVSYGRLREACQTDVDGTSIDMLETVAVQLGLNAEQILVPVDHLFLPETMALPAIVVVRQPSGVTHFVVAWRRHGRVVQVMDPATGRRWPTCRRFLDELYVHTQSLPATAWRAWAETDEFLGGLRRRWAALAIGGAEGERLLGEALAHPAWVPLAALDATTRMLTAHCAWLGAPPWPASDTGVGHVVCPCLPGGSRPDHLRSLRPIGWCARRPLLRTVHRRSWYAAPFWCASAGAGVFPCPGQRRHGSFAGAPPPLPPDLVAALEAPRVGLDGNCCACSAPMASWLPRSWGLAYASRPAV